MKEELEKKKNIWVSQFSGCLDEIKQSFKEISLIEPTSSELSKKCQVGIANSNQTALVMPRSDNNHKNLLFKDNADTSQTNITNRTSLKPAFETSQLSSYKTSGHFYQNIDKILKSCRSQCDFRQLNKRQSLKPIIKRTSSLSTESVKRVTFNKMMSLADPVTELKPFEDKRRQRLRHLQRKHFRSLSLNESIVDSMQHRVEVRDFIRKKQALPLTSDILKTMTKIIIIEKNRSIGSTITESFTSNSQCSSVDSSNSHSHKTMSSRQESSISIGSDRGGSTPRQLTIGRYDSPTGEDCETNERKNKKKRSLLKRSQPVTGPDDETDLFTTDTSDSSLAIKDQSISFEGMPASAGNKTESKKPRQLPTIPCKFKPCSLCGLF